MRKAARSFDGNTSIGTDLWTFKEIAAMPDKVLEELERILKKVRKELAMPLQTHLSMMAIIPKKTGGSRTVAISSTFDRLLMALDDERLKQFESEQAYDKDSAKAGASTSRAAEDRALNRDLRAAQGKQTCTMLWDMANFFDTLDIRILIEEAEAAQYPMEELLLILTIHQAPRRLKIGKAVGTIIAALGRALLAGCKRAAQMARAYTVCMVRKLAVENTQVDLYQHVDGMTNLVRPEAQHLLAETAINYIMDFEQEARRLKMQTSDKSTIVPSNATTKKICRVANRKGIPLKTADAGADIGVDTASASKRTTKQQKKRINAAAKRAQRTRTLARANRRAVKLGVTSIKPTQEFGATAVGISPAAINCCKRNIAKATGLSGPGACATSVLAWTLRDSRLKKCKSIGPRGLHSNLPKSNPGCGSTAMRTTRRSRRSMKHGTR